MCKHIACIGHLSDYAFLQRRIAYAGTVHAPKHPPIRPATDT